MAKKEKKQKSKALKIIEYVLFGIFGALFCFVLAGNISSMIHKKENYGQPIRFGMGTFQIITDSMEPDIGKGTVVISYKEDVTEFDKRLKNNENVDVVFANVIEISGFTPDNPQYTNQVTTYEIMVHRLQEVHINEDVEYGKGRYIFVAAGINDKGMYSNKEQYQVFTEAEYLGTVKVTSSFLGGFTKVISSPIGLIILLLIPAGYLIVVSSIDIFKAVKEEDNDGAEVSTNKVSGSERLDSLSAKDRERLKNELLDEMIKSKKEGK